MFIDTHCHLDSYDDLEKIIKKMEKNIIIASGVNTITNKHVIELCNKYNNVYGTIGYHPEEIVDWDKDSLKFLENNLSNPKIVGIGEIGLDYYWNKENKEKQKEIFLKQLELAEKYNKTVVIHSRDSIEDTYNILKNKKNIKMNIHCFSSSYEMAEKFIKLGAKIGVGGVITFKNGIKLKEVVEKIDLEHILLETDSPYLTPEPFRGKENEPYNAYYVAKKIAEIKNISIDEVFKLTTDNAIKQFDLNVEI